MTGWSHGMAAGGRGHLGAILGLAVALLQPASGLAQESHIRFDRLTIQDGLSQSSINCILQDRQGYMWFGTQDGLNRYDGFEFRVFNYKRGKSGTLSRPWVWSLLEDRQGVIWVATTDGGLNRWDPQSETFTSYTHDPDDPASLSDDRVRTTFEDRAGRIWVGTEAGLNRLEADPGTFTRYLHDPSDPTGLSSDDIRSILEDSLGYLWVGTYGGGLNRLDPETGKAERFVHDPDDPHSLGEDRIRTIFEDSAGALWIGTYEAGVDRYDRETGRFTHFTHDPSDSSSLSDDRVRAILQDREGALWIGTDLGLNLWRPRTRDFSHYQHNPARSSSLSDDRVMSIFQDRGGVLWVGTLGGVNKWNPTTGSFVSYSRDPSAEWTLTGDEIQSFAETSDGMLWIGTYNGLNSLDRGSGEVRQFLPDPNDPYSLRDERVFSLLGNGPNGLWVGTFEGGLHSLDRRTGRFETYPHDPDDPSSISSDKVSALLRGSGGELWIGTYGGGLNRFDEARSRFLHHRHDPQNPNSLGSDNVVALLEDSDGTLWVGTHGGGFAGLDRETGESVTFRAAPDDPLGLPSEDIWAFHETADGTLWIGTRSAGLLSWSRRHRRARRPIFQQYTTDDGLANNVVYSIESDDAGNLWISTNEGLSRFDPERRLFRNYDETHGLLSREFNFSASLRLSTGEMVFGGINGFNLFLPQRIHTNDNVPPVVLTRILKLNEEIETERAIQSLAEIELSHKDSMVSFEFAALDYTAPANNRFQYMLEGFDDDWRQQDRGLRRATYTNLDAGEYIFRVRGSNNDGVWNDVGAQIRVHVVPPPWRTWWAYALYLLALAIVILGYTRSQARKYREKAEYSHKLEREVRARTSELADRNRELEQANIKLQLASITDSLTGLRNRRYLATSIEKDIALVDRYHADLLRRGVDRSLARPDYLFLVFDLDGFKEVNDAFGHAAGDRVLIQVREHLESDCRKSDTLVRWGGDEFLVVGRYTDRQAAERLSERILNRMAEHEFELGNGQSIQLSCSIGFAYYPFVTRAPGYLNWEQVLVVADRALYIAKNSGRKAWVGISGTDSTETVDPEALIERINNDVEGLLSDGSLELRTSISDGSSLVWAWA